MTTEQNANLAPTDKSSTTFSANISRTIFLKSFCAELTEEQEKLITLGKITGVINGENKDINKDMVSLLYGDMVELVDTRDLKCCGLWPWEFESPYPY